MKTRYMKHILFFAVILNVLVSCKKDRTDPVPDTVPEMIYMDLKDSAIYFNKAAFFDFDGDRQKDIYFGTMLVGDPVMQADKKQWLVMSSFYTNLPVNGNENIPVLNVSDPIPVQTFPGYNWYNASSVLLTQKVITDHAGSYWLGEWRNASHQFIPFQIIRSTGLFNGWVEVSFDMDSEKLLLHKAAVSREPYRMVKAGN